MRVRIAYELNFELLQLRLCYYIFQKRYRLALKLCPFFFYIHFLIFIFLPLGASRTRWIHSNNNGLTHCGNIFSKSVCFHMNIHLESSLFGHNTYVSPLSSLCLSHWTAERNMSCLHPSGTPLCSPSSWSLIVCVYDVRCWAAFSRLIKVEFSEWKIETMG